MISVFGLKPANPKARLSGKWEIAIVILSLLIQIPIAYFLGHSYDQRVYMATGYVVGSGMDPYSPIELVNVFANPVLDGVVPRIGYPPPWPLILGVIYSSSHKLIPDVFLYNLAIKVPIIAANVGLAYLVRHILLDLRVARKKAEAAWLFLLFNPFIILTSSAWGQIDTLVTLASVGSLYLLSKGKISLSAILLGFSISMKPIALGLVPLPFFFQEKFFSRKNLKFGLVFLAIVAILAVSPFFVFGWRMPLTPVEWNTQFRMAGGMTLFSVSELFQGSVVLPLGLEFAGFLWVPALVIGYFFVYRNPPRSLETLVLKVVGLTLIFFFTRSWLSEPNVSLVLVFMLIAFAIGKLDKLSLHLAWIVPLLYMIVSTAFHQLFFLSYPSILTSLADFDLQFRTLRLIARFPVALVWFILAWRTTVNMLGSQRKQTASSSFSGSSS